MNPTTRNRQTREGIRPPRAVRCSSRSYLLALGLVLPLLVLLATGTGRAAAPTESEVKAAFLYKFVTYTDWPATTFSKTGSPILLGVFADEQFATTLASVVGTNRVRGRPLIVRKLQTVDETKGCHLIFFAAAESARLPPVVARLKLQPVLLVGEDDKFCWNGGMIALRVASGKVRFEVDAARILSTGLKISSQVIQLSVPSGKDGEIQRVRH